MKTYFDEKDNPFNWSLLDNGMGIKETENLNPANAALNHVFATWKPYPEGKEKVWRIDEIAHVGQSADVETVLPQLDGLEQADLLIVQDWGMKIHDLSIPELAEQLREKWVIYRCYPPVFAGNLWRSFHHQLGQKEIIVLNASDLRMMDVSISKGVSWEQTLQDIITETYCKRNISLHPLHQADYVVISFGHTGTLLIQNRNSSKCAAPEIQFFFDSTGVEGYWEIAHPGYLPGSMELLLVLLAKEILRPKNHGTINFAPAIRTHLLGSRALHLAGANIAEGSLSLGLLPVELDKVYGSKPTQSFSPVSLDFDHFSCLYQAKHNGQFTSARDWSLLSKTKWDFYSLARRTSVLGPMKALQGLNIPIAKYNHLITVDRKEIEFLHHLQSLFTEYLQNVTINLYPLPSLDRRVQVNLSASNSWLNHWGCPVMNFNPSHSISHNLMLITQRTSTKRSMLCVIFFFQAKSRWSFGMNLTVMN